MESTITSVNSNENASSHRSGLSAYVTGATAMDTMGAVKFRRQQEVSEPLKDLLCVNTSFNHGRETLQDDNYEIDLCEQNKTNRICDEIIFTS